MAAWDYCQSVATIVKEERTLIEAESDTSLVPLVEPRDTLTPTLVELEC